MSADGGTSVIADGDQFYIVDDGKGAAGDEDNCGNDMEGVPYIVVSATEDGTAIDWDTDKAGDAMVEGTLSTVASLNISHCWCGLHRRHLQERSADWWQRQGRHRNCRRRWRRCDFSYRHPR